MASSPSPAPPPGRADMPAPSWTSASSPGQSSCPKTARSSGSTRYGHSTGRPSSSACSPRSGLSPAGALAPISLGNRSPPTGSSSPVVSPPAPTAAAKRYRIFTRPHELQPSGPDRFHELLIVFLVLIRVPLREVGDRCVERVGWGQDLGNRNWVPGACVGTGQIASADARVEREPERIIASTMVEPSCRGAGASRSGGARPVPWSSRGRCRWLPASSAAPAPPARRAGGSGCCARTVPEPMPSPL